MFFLRAGIPSGISWEEQFDGRNFTKLKQPVKHLESLLWLTSVISTVLASISCRARTESDCTRTKEHIARSGGTLCRVIESREEECDEEQRVRRTVKKKKRKEVLPERWMWFPGSRDDPRSPHRTDIVWWFPSGPRQSTGGKPGHPADRKQQWGGSWEGQKGGRKEGRMDE